MSTSVPSLVLWTLATVAVYAGTRRLFLWSKQPLLHPMFTALLALIVLVELLGRRYGEYRAATGWIGWWLGPAVVAMAVPVWRLRTLVRAQLGALVGVVAVGLLFGFGSMALLLTLLRQPPDVVAAGTLKSITSPVALELARTGGARVDAMVAGVVLAGAAGATVGPGVLRRLGVRDRRARGLAMGCGSHGVGVARAMEVDPVCGAFATLGMSGTAMLGAVVCPYLLRWLAG